MPSARKNRYCILARQSAIAIACVAAMISTAQAQEAARAGIAKIVIIWHFTDTHESLVSTLEHRALTVMSGTDNPNADATVTTTRQVIEPVILGQRTLANAMANGITVRGSASSVSGLWALLVDFKSGIPLVEPALSALQQTGFKVQHISAAMPVDQYQI